ncbi:vitellogenin receptor isoform X2 [Plodia interpunctella]|uniref:vitellogenin receptor isoform X2 n=1 Tax=Plodia interpunctella TaxID=58824 RepID=UPI0023684298|nr:vitellogenin receptor isoform X2 [Plodia interpunctella]
MATVYIILAWFATCGAQFIDELQGYDQSCLGEEKFQCADGTCIPQEQYCDSRVQCLDASDENFCPDYAPNPEFCNSTTHFLCLDQKKCVPNTWLCNKLPDCDDGSDEVNCTNTAQPAQNATCKGFFCDKTKCISEVWTCDGRYDCEDLSDESQDICKEHISRLKYLDMDRCMSAQKTTNGFEKHYRCIDSSFCLPAEMMCDGMPDCRDGSDEGTFCKNWHTVCSSNPCHLNAMCAPERFGFSCVCPQLSRQSYNYTTNVCEDVDECALVRPYCSHSCFNFPTGYKCYCDEGYIIDETTHLCHAKGPEAVLFYSTKNEIGYVGLKTKKRVTLTTGNKQAHGVAYDGNYIYWVETAQGHQAIIRAHMENVEETTEVLVSLGLEDPGDIAVDWLGGHIYFSDAERGIISVCRTNGFICTTLPAPTKNPRFVTLDVKHGNMFWGDWFGVPVIMMARMDGTQSKVLVDGLSSFPTGLTVDVPNGRLYYVDRTIYVVKIDNKQVYSLFKDPFNHPYAIAVFENTVYWSDWTSRSIQTMDKLVHNEDVRRQLVTMKAPVFDMHIYHPVLIDRKLNPCSNHNCSHLCLVSTQVTYTCACPDGMKLGHDTANSNTCYNVEGFRPHYLVVSSGNMFTRVQYNSMGNPETPTHFDIGWVHAMAYDSRRDALYIYDGQIKTINTINMTDFQLGLTHPVLYDGLGDVVDLDYDFVTDTLYILDAGRRFVEVVSLKNNQRALLYRFRDEEIPISLCVMPDHGKMLVALRDSVYSSNIHIDSIGLDGSARKPLIMNNLAGPHIRLKYSRESDTVYLADETNTIIEYMTPEGKGRERFRSLSTTVTGLSVTDTYVFWTDRRTPRVFWADVHDVTHRVRRFEFSLFPNGTRLHLQATASLPNPNSTLMNHPCLTANSICSDICVQTPHNYPTESKPLQMGYRCLCPPTLLLVNGVCTKLKTCNFEQDYYCYKSNECVLKNKRCNGAKDCTQGEDEEGCDVKTFGQQGDDIQCSANEILCKGKCIDNYFKCPPTKKYFLKPEACERNEFHCWSSVICLDRSQVCNMKVDCPFSNDENPEMCKHWKCRETEFKCGIGQCVNKTVRCDGQPDCIDGTDEADCYARLCSVGYFQCLNQNCVEVRKRCNGVDDCMDNSDEQSCEEIFPEKEVPVPQCTEMEHACELNKSICIPVTARCNLKFDCPGGTDEQECDQLCAPRGMFKCKQQTKCLHRDKICNSVEDCNDGSDEFPEACLLVNRTSLVIQLPLFPVEECPTGFHCADKECMEWNVVCDKEPDCFDGSDENGQCDEACANNTCEYDCQPTPSGQRCNCPRGLTLNDDLRTCADIDECDMDLCSQYCHNTKGSYLCSCYNGYTLRPDHHSCKATAGDMAIVYVAGNTVRSLATVGEPSMQFYHPAHPSSEKIAFIDIDVRRKTTFVTIPNAQKMVVVTGPMQEVSIKNIGEPTKVAVDWVTGNVYFVDQKGSYVRVCDAIAMKCARLQKLPLAAQSKVTAFVVDPGSRRMFYCITNRAGSESVLWTATLTGRAVDDIAVFGNCSGLALDSFGKRLYVAEASPVQISRVDLDGKKQKKVFYDQSHLKAPQGRMVLFEDWIYFKVANSHKLNRCQLNDKKLCETYISRNFDADSFFIKHPSAQRNDIQNLCQGIECNNVCALDDSGAHCLCHHGEMAISGECYVPDISQWPVFFGGTEKYFTEARRVTWIVLSIIIAVFFICVAVYCFYIKCIKKRSERPEHRVIYHSPRVELEQSATPTPSSTPTPTPTDSRPDTAVPSDDFAEAGPSTAPQYQAHAHRQDYSSLNYKRYMLNWFQRRSRPSQSIRREARGVRVSTPPPPPYPSPADPNSDRELMMSSPPGSASTSTPPLRFNEDQSSTSDPNPGDSQPHNVFTKR